MANQNNPSANQTSPSPAPTPAAPASGGTSDQEDARAIIDATLAQYGLQSLSTWAWNEITAGASTDQVTLDMTQTPQFKQRFPGIVQRQQAGLPAISPADYVTYEDQAKQLENQYGLPSGFLSNSQRVGQLIGQDVSMTELSDRVQNGYAAVQYAPPSVRQAFTQMFGVNGEGALASHFLDSSVATPLLTQQATAAQISGQASAGGINMDTQTAMQLAQSGHTQSDVGSSLADLEKQNPLYNATITEQQNLDIGKEGVEAEFGLTPSAEQQVIQRQQARQGQFQGGGSAYSDQYGAEGVGKANPV